MSRPIRYLLIVPVGLLFIVAFSLGQISHWRMHRCHR